MSSTPRLDGKAVPFVVLDTAARACAAVRASEARAGVRAHSWSPARHALARFGFGPYGPPMGSGFDPDNWWRAQVALGFRHRGYAGVSGLVHHLPALALDAPQTTAWLKRTAGNGLSWMAMQQLTAGTVLLQAYSSAQLYESVVDFFANHLNVANNYDAAASTRITYDRDTIRAHAFGRFRDMLQASAPDVTMQRYLTLSQSTAGALNENYGRELLELHTVTPRAGYTQSEVVSSSRIMTGRFHDGGYRYQYMPGRHWNGPVRVLGFSSANATGAGGEKVGDDYLAYLASHPMTAQNLARKLCVRFVSDTPSSGLVDAVARAYLVNDTAILPTLSVIFRSTEFWAMHGAKLRRPAESVIATVRALRLRPQASLATTGEALVELCTLAGQVPLSWPSPDGYPDTAQSWQSAGAFSSAWVAQYDLVTDRWASSFQPWTPTNLLAGDRPRTTGQALDRLAGNLLGAPLAASQKASLLVYLREMATTPFRSSKVGGSELRPMIALLLHSPQHAHR